MMKIGTQILSALALACVLLPCAQVCAATPDDKTESEYRYDFKILNGQLVRVDRLTGKVEAVAVGESKPVAAAEGAKKEVPSTAPASSDGAATVAAQQDKNKGPQIKSINNEPVDPNYVPDRIDAVHRERSAKDVQDYLPNLGLTELLAIQENGTVISGTISVKNRGIKSLAALELTVVVPIGKDKKPHEYPILLSFKPGHKRPPQPAAHPDEQANAEYVPVNFPSPGMVSGPIEVRVTYLKFSK